MYERFTDRARRVVVLAQVEARALHHHQIGTEHLLAALLAEYDGVAARVLRETGLTVEAVRAEIETALGRGLVEHPGSIPFTERTRDVLSRALREALQLGHNYIGTEHLLLGLLALDEGLAAQILTSHGLDAASLRAAVHRLFGPASVSAVGGVGGGGARSRRVDVTLLDDADEGIHALAMIEHYRQVHQRWAARQARHAADEQDAAEVASAMAGAVEADAHVLTQKLTDLSAAMQDILTATEAVLADIHALTPVPEEEESDESS